MSQPPQPPPARSGSGLPGAATYLKAAEKLQPVIDALNEQGPDPVDAKNGVATAMGVLFATTAHRSGWSKSLALQAVTAAWETLDAISAEDSASPAPRSEGVE